MNSNTISRAMAVLCLLALTSPINAHTWIEELRLIASNGSYVGAAGYPRGLIARGLSSTDVMTHLVPATPTATDSMCEQGTAPGSQMLGVQTSGLPRLQAAANDSIALRYEENGHVSKFATNLGKPLGRGVVYIYGTKVAANSDTFLGVHGAWTPDGTGGDKRGKLLATRNYDDGHCYQANSDPTVTVVVDRAKAANSTVLTEVLCQSDLQLPADIGTSGTYTLYWVWDWSTLYLAGQLNTNETYTSCMDIDVVSTPVPNAGAFTATQSGANVNSAAIADQMDKTFIVDASKVLAVAPDNLGIAMPPGVNAVAKRPVLASEPGSGASSGSSGSSSAINSQAAGARVPAVPTTTASAAQSSQATTSAAQSSKASVSSAPKYITVTVEKEVVETITITASEGSSTAAQPTSSIKPASKVNSTSSIQSASIAAPVAGNALQPFFTTLSVSTVTQATTHSASTSQASGGVFVSPAASSQNTSMATGTGTGSSVVIVPVSTASGLYSTATAVPSTKPFLTFNGRKRAIRGIGRRV